jgi:hypothetical protein
VLRIHAVALKALQKTNEAELKNFQKAVTSKRSPTKKNLCNWLN